MTPRPCTWPDGGCGEPIIDVVTRAGADQVVDAKAEKRIVLVRSTDDLVLAGQVDIDAGQFLTRVVWTYVDHHATCTAFQLYQKRKRERAAGQATKAGRG